MDWKLVKILMANLALISALAFCLSPETKPGASGKPYVSNVEIEKFLFEDQSLYIRFKIIGEADLRKELNINGVYGWWSGRITITLPDGSQGQLLIPEDHTEFFVHFTQIPGTLKIDLELPWFWFEERCLGGNYTVTVWLMGPYENRTVLYSKTFNLKIAPKATVSPTSWKSWEEKISITITNNGNVPLVVRGVGMETSVGTVIGWIYNSKPEERILVIMPGETKVWSGTPTITGDFKEIFSGKTEKIDFVLDIAGACQRFATAATISFP